MNFTQFIGSFKTGDASWEESPVLFERIHIAKNIIKGIYSNKRTIKAPEYLTDFGLRKTDSPRIFIKEYCKKLDKQMPSVLEVKKELLELDIRDLGDWIDGVVLVLGDYDSSYEVLKERMADVLKEFTVDNLIKMATLCGIENDASTALKLFNQAHTKCTDRETKEVILHRIDVTLLKREKNIDEFFKHSNSLITDINLSNDLGEIAALLNNLVAFQLILSNQENHHNNLILARLLLANGKIILNNAINKFTHINMKLTELVRYYSQIAINQVQIEIELNNIDIAKKIMLQDVEMVHKYNDEYLSEALSSLAYIYYIDKQYDQAVNTALSAIDEHIKIGNVIGINETKKLITASFYKMGEEEKAKQILKTIKSDPIGILENYDKYYI